MMLRLAHHCALAWNLGGKEFWTAYTSDAVSVSATPGVIDGTVPGSDLHGLPCIDGARDRTDCGQKGSIATAALVIG
jgi:hypothetical protein